LLLMLLMVWAGLRDSTVRVGWKLCAAHVDTVVCAVLHVCGMLERRRIYVHRTCALTLLVHVVGRQPRPTIRCDRV
jgi:hypothetical protein